jgi:uncharacterized membrane protein
MSANLPTQPQALEEPRTLTHVLYALHTITWFSGGIFSVIAIIINLVKSPDLPNAFYRSHWRWQARTFWFALIAFVVTLPLWLVFVFPGWIAWCLIGLWYLYRCLRGWIRFNDGRAMPTPETAP